VGESPAQALFLRQYPARGFAFEYLADPKAILKGRVIVLAGFVVYSLVGKINPLAGLAMALVFLGVLPWLIVRASRFNAVNSAHRNVRFDFRAGYWEMARLLVLPVVLVPLTLGLLYPYYAYCKSVFSWGTAPTGQRRSYSTPPTGPTSASISRRR